MPDTDDLLLDSTYLVFPAQVKSHLQQATLVTT
jgi:hypothetical protein